jgi:archaellum component FlaC
MESTVKPGADLLWAFQLHREHRALSKRLTAVEATAAKHQDKVTASEQKLHAAQHERVDALAERLRKLEDSDISEQVAGLASELRGSRQQLEQVRDKVKLVEKASKAAVGKSEDRDEALQNQLGELSSSVVQLQRRVGHSESRLQRLTDDGVHAAADGLQMSSERHEDQIKKLSEELRGLERAQGQLRGLIENAVQDYRVAPAVPAPTRSKTVENARKDVGHSMSNRVVGSNGQPRDGPHPILDGHGPEQEVVEPPASQLPSKTMSPDAETSALPVTRAAQKEPSGTTKRKRFEKEISQLMYGDGSLTYAPIILESQDLGATTRGGKKLKVDVFEGRSLRSAFTKPESQSELTKIKEEPARVRAKAPALPRKALVTASKTATRTANTQRAPKIAAAKTRGRKAAPELTKTLSTKQPLRLSRSSEILVAYSQASSASEKEPVATSPSLPMKKENGHSKRQKQLPQQQPKKARRCIVQDDSMEEFLAKCEAAIGT